MRLLVDLGEEIGDTMCELCPLVNRGEDGEAWCPLFDANLAEDADGCTLRDSHCIEAEKLAATAIGFCRKLHPTAALCCERPRGHDGHCFMSRKHWGEPQP